MDSKRPFFTGIPDLPMDPAQREEMIRSMLRQAAATAGESTMGAFSEIQQRRVTRLSNAAKVLSKKLGPDNPDAVAADNLAQSLGNLKTQWDTQAARLKQWPTLRPNEWTVYGTVTDAQGKPAGGLTVRVFDRDRKYDDLLGETTTSEFGDFAVVYHERDFKETGEQLPDLYVMVSDASGKTVYSSRDSVRFESGRSEYFAIRLGEQPKKAKRKKG